MADQILASALSNEKHLAAFEELAADRLDSIEAEKVLTMLVQAVDAEALDTLATQLNIDGFKGFDYAGTEQEKRDVLGRAIRLNSLKGTPAGIRLFIELAGYAGVQFIEGIGRYYDGSHLHEYYVGYAGLYNYANFTIILDEGDKPLGYEDRNLLKEYLKSFKPERSPLIYIDIGPLSDVADDEEYSLAAREINTALDVGYDGGAINYLNPSTESLTYRGSSYAVETENYELEDNVLSVYSYDENAIAYKEPETETIEYRGQSWKIETANFEKYT